MIIHICRKIENKEKKEPFLYQILKHLLISKCLVIGLRPVIEAFTLSTEFF